METLRSFPQSDPGVKTAGRGTPLLGGRWNALGCVPGNSFRYRKNQFSLYLYKQKSGPDVFWFLKAVSRMGMLWKQGSFQCFAVELREQPCL